MKKSLILQDPYESVRPISKNKKQKVIGLMKGEISGKIMQEFLRLWAKIYSYLTDESKREKDTNE